MAGRAQREQVAADALAALGNRTRLRVFKLLVRAGSQGANIGTIQRSVFTGDGQRKPFVSGYANAGVANLLDR